MFLNKKNKKIKLQKRAIGSAIMLVMFILSGIMIIVFASSSIVLNGLKMGSVQADSVRSYYSAESGAELLLYNFRQEKLLDTLNTPPQENILFSSNINTTYFYTVNYDSYFPLKFTSIGEYNRTRRSVEISFY